MHHSRCSPVRRSGASPVGEASLPGQGSLAAIVSILLGSIFPQQADGTDWPTYRHDVNRSAVSAIAIEPALHLQWTYQAGRPPETAWPLPGEETPRMHTDRVFHPVVGDGLMYFGSSSDHVMRALDPATGQTVWRFYADGAIRFAPHFYEGRLYFGADDGYVYCLNASDGDLEWRYRPSPADERIIGNGRMVSLWPVRTGVIVDEGTLYVAAGVFPYEGLYICALDARSGDEIWKNDTAGDLAWGLEYGGMAPQGYLLVSPSTLYVPSGRGMPAAFDRHDGTFKKFLSQGGKVGGSWALLDQGKLIAGVNQQGNPAKIVFDEESFRKEGDLFANFPGIDLVLTAQMALTLTENGIVAIDREVHRQAIQDTKSLQDKRKALSTETADLRKQYDALKEKEAKSDLATNDDVAEALAQNKKQIRRIQATLAGLSGEIQSIDDEIERLKTIAVRWQLPQDNLWTMALSGDTLYASGQNRVIAVDSETGQLTWESAVEGLALSLAIGESRLFVATDLGHIYCFGSQPVDASVVVRDPAASARWADSARSTRIKGIATRILEESGIRQGFCLVANAGEGLLAYELARQSDLKIVAIAPDPVLAATARRNLFNAGIYGSRVMVATWDLSELPDYFANLIVDERSVMEGEEIKFMAELSRILRPTGGVLVSNLIKGQNGRPVSAKEWMDAVDPSAEDGTLRHLERGWTLYQRGPLKGAGSWNGLYGNAENTGSSVDELVKGPMGVLWYGEPGSEFMLDRHARAASPLAVHGRLFVQGMEVVMGYDAYNGTFLWEKKIPGAVRSRVDVDGSNLFATDDYLFVAAEDKTFQLEAQTGEIVREFTVPTRGDGAARRWGYISVTDHILLGSAAIPLNLDYGTLWNAFVSQGQWQTDDRIPEPCRQVMARGGTQTLIQYMRKKFPTPNKKAYDEFKRDGYHWKFSAKFPTWVPDHDPSGTDDRMMISDAVFAYSTETGERLWSHEGRHIPQISVVAGEGTVFVVKSDVTEEEKAKADQDRLKTIKAGTYAPHDEGTLPPEKRDYRRIVALDLQSGRESWARVMDMSGCGANKLGATYHDGRLLFFGHYSNHDQGPFAEGKLAWRRITVLNASDGEMYWSKPMNYRRRPLVLKDTIIIEPRACSLSTGEIKTRQHPITGAEVPWEFLRPGHSCGIVTATPNNIFFRSFSAAIVNVERDTGLQLFGGMRPGCWNSMIPANGLLSMQEASAGCTCSYALRTTVVLNHKPQKGLGEWTVFISNEPTLPVSHLALNMGAPGDMRAQDGTLWFAYPRPNTSTGQGPYKNYGVKFDLEENKEASVLQQDYRGVEFEGTDKPWLYTSALRGLNGLTIPLLPEGETGVYQVKMGFLSTSESDASAKRHEFRVGIQDQEIPAEFASLPNSSMRDGRAIELVFSEIEIKETLQLEWKTLNGAEPPSIRFVEIVRTDQPPSSPGRLNPID